MHNRNRSLARVDKINTPVVERPRTMRGPENRRGVLPHRERGARKVDFAPVERRLRIRVPQDRVGAVRILDAAKERRQQRLLGRGQTNLLLGRGQEGFVLVDGGDGRPEDWNAAGAGAGAVGSLLHC